MHNFIILTGRPGCGKSFLIKELLMENPNYTSFDVYKYIKIIKDHYGKVPEQMIINAYKKIYEQIASATADIVLEIGTNYPGFNLHKLAEFSDSFKINLFFCHLDIEICKRRCLIRATADKSKDFKGDSLDLRLKRIFPDLHQRFADRLKISYHDIDMSLPYQERLNLINNIICD